MDFVATVLEAVDNELHLQTYEKRGIFWKCLLEEEELLAHVSVLRTCFLRLYRECNKGVLDSSCNGTRCAVRSC